MKNSSSTLAIFTSAAVLYCIVVLWYVATSHDAGLRCLPANSSNAERFEEARGVEIRVSPPSGEDVVSRVGPSVGDGDMILPRQGDMLVEFYGRPIRSFVDFSWAHTALRNARIDSGGAMGSEHVVGRLSELLPKTSRLNLIEFPDNTRYVKIRFRRQNSDEIEQGWLKLRKYSSVRVGVTLLWFILQLAITLISLLAAWQRPFDQSLRLFCYLGGVTLVAFVGGDHWWVISGSLPLLIPFTVSAILLPAILLQFFLTYPVAKPWFNVSPAISRAAIYFIPIMMSLGTVTMILASWWFSQSWGEGPLASAMEQTLAQNSLLLMNLLQTVVLSYLTVSSLYFAASLLAMAESLLRARSFVERQQVQSILWAGMAAAVPVGYAMYLALFDPERFALGSSQGPMFLASLSFMLAYAIGIARFKLLLIDQVLSRGMWYFVLSAGLGIFFSAIVGVGSIVLHSQNASLFGQPVPMVVVLMLVVYVLLWLKDQLQRTIDREYFSEKYQLDRALLRMNRAVSNLWERDAVAGNLLGSCCEVLRVEQAALYLWMADRSRFVLVAAVGWPEVPASVPGNVEQLKLLGPGSSIQRIPSGDSGEQILVRSMNAELITGLDVDGEVGGIVALGSKPSGAAFTAEDVAFLAAMGRITGVALHCAKVHEDVSRLNEDLQRKIEKIDDQDRRIALLQSMVDSLSAPQRALGTGLADLQRSAIKGNGPAITQVLESVKKIAVSEASVLVRGESGTGKELLARTIHENSSRKNGPLVAVHCAALSSQLLESELFGHVKGAFTDAREDKQGRFAMASGGTLFLDEIGDISLDVQIKLLRVLQERTFEPVGSSTPVSVDVRLIAATHQNLERLIAEGKFREDLYYRLNVISVTLPPLRDRQEDLFELSMYFLTKAAERAGKSISYVDEVALEAMAAYHWPGNIRELQNVIERAVVLCEGRQITVADLPHSVAQATFLSQSAVVVDPTLSRPRIGQQFSSSTASRVVVGSETERQQLVAALQRCNGNKAEAARLLGIPRSTFFSKLRRHGLG